MRRLVNLAGLSLVLCLLWTNAEADRPRCTVVTKIAPTRTTTEELWRDYKTKGNILSRNELMLRYQVLVQRTAERISARLPSEAPSLEELVSAGQFGLMDAIDGFDLGRGYKFETYAPRRIKGAILDALREWDPVPRLVRSRSSTINGERDLFLQENGRAPSHEEIRAKLVEKFGETRADKIINDSLGDKWMKGLNIFNRRPHEDSDRENSSLRDPKTIDPAEQNETRQFWEIVSRGLSRAERMILVLYYQESMTMKDIGAVSDLSESRVSQMHSNLILRIRGQFEGIANDLRSLATHEP